MTQTAAAGDEQVSVPLRTVVNAGQLAVGVVRETLRPGALELPVRWAHVCELLDPAPYLLGDELLLTSGVNLPGEPAEVDRYVRRLRAAGITALGFGVTPPMHEELPESLRAACARHGLPLLVVPERVPFLAVSRAVSVALEEAGRREQRRIVEAREALTSAAADGLDEVIGVLGRRLAGWACLVDGAAVGSAAVGGAAVVDATVVGTAEVGESEGGDTGGAAVLAGYRVPRPLPAEATELLARAGAGSGLRSASTQLADGTYLLAQPVYPRAAASPLVIAGRRDRFGLAERAILGVGAALLGLAGGAGSDAARLGGAATALLLDGLGGQRPAQVAAALLGPGEYRVLAGVAYRRGPGRAAAGYHWLRARLDTPLVEVTEGPRFTAIARGTVGLAQLDGLRADGWLVVAGSAVPAARLAEAVSEVDSLLQRAVALQRPVLARSAGLAAMVGPAAGADFAARLLAPLRELELDRPGEPLVDTLRTWLANHGGWDRTAAALGVHRNSVRHRIARVERHLGVDLADPETRMELWFALRWSR